ncbi:MAG: hypothetical protein JXR14_03785 [Paracoccaceae bacterium]
MDAVALRLIFSLLLVIALWPASLAAQDKTFRLSAPDALTETGFLKHLLPRFSLKTGIRITVVAPGEPAEASFGEQGVPAFQGGDAIWRFSHAETEHTTRFATWLGSDVGRRTIESFKRDGAPLFSAQIRNKKVEVAVSFDGDAKLGAELSLTHCGRCHVIGEINRQNGIDSTPSFSVLRTLSNWEDRFQAFFALNPHPAFTQIKDVTEPFDPERPPPIVPLRLTLDELEAILAYVAEVDPADLGAPIQSQ